MTVSSRRAKDDFRITTFTIGFVMGGALSYLMAYVIIVTLFSSPAFYKTEPKAIEITFLISSVFNLFLAIFLKNSSIRIGLSFNSYAIWIGLILSHLLHGLF